jgi:hypothetical protein
MKAPLLAAATGHSLVPAKPTITYTGVGQFTISGYDPSLTYTHVGATNSSGVLSITATDAEVTVTARSPKGVTQSASVVIGRKPLVNDVYHHDWICTNETFDNCGPPGGSCGCGTLGGCGNPNDCCGWVCHSGYYNDYYTLNYGPAGSGYTNNANEWQKVV